MTDAERADLIAKLQEVYNQAGVQVEVSAMLVRFSSLNPHPKIKLTHKDGTDHTKGKWLDLGSIYFLEPIEVPLFQLAPRPAGIDEEIYNLHRIAFENGFFLVRFR